MSAADSLLPSALPSEFDTVMVTVVVDPCTAKKKIIYFTKYSKVNFNLEMVTYLSKCREANEDEQSYRAVTEHLLVYRCWPADDFPFRMQFLIY